MTHTPAILVVGAADTGRAPILVALLQRMLAQHGYTWPVASAGVTGHDGEPAEPEARDTMAAFGLDIIEHRARSVSEELIAEASLVITTDRGVLRVLRMMYPAAAARMVTLGELAGKQRDIPDLFRMQIGAWMSYTREMETLLADGWARLVALAAPAPPAEAAPVVEGVALPAEPAPVALAAETPAIASEREAALQRLERLLQIMQDMPELLNWEQTRIQFQTDLTTVAQHPLDEADLAEAYARLLGSIVNMRTTPPNTEQMGLLKAALQNLRTRINTKMIMIFP
ncbi:MAG: low molecular weight phosphatase family protein [Chloroflexaceae bacterium]|nr:low molecular weight phosphatase family protein [Chloroflexaceae bacterium]